MIQKIDLQELDEILFGKWRPLLSPQKSDDHYSDLLDSYIHIARNEDLNFKVIFNRPFNSKTTFYYQLIQDALYVTVSHLIELVDNSPEPQLKAYWVNGVINKLKTRFKDLHERIRSNNYDLKYIDPKHTTFDHDIDHKSNTYIIQLLKFSFIQLYLEFQETFKSNLKELFSEEDLYARFLMEIVPDNMYIHKIVKIDINDNISQSHNILEGHVDKSHISKRVNSEDEHASSKDLNMHHREMEEKTVSNFFNPIKKDLPGIRPGKVSFEALVRNPELFAQVETKLFEYELIDADYCFIKNKKESNSTHLAAIIKILIQYNYFRRNILGSKKEYSDNDIREFIENRYQADISQQFRRMKPEQLDQTKNKHPWVDKLLSL